jgi:nicotinamidase-related amidase
VDSTPVGVPCREENFKRRELEFPLPVEQTALVIIDPWNKHHIESWVERAERMMRDVIAPLLMAARGAGLTVVFAPSPEVLASVPGKYRIYKGRAAAPPAIDGAPAVEPPSPAWPPKDFLQRRGPYKLFANPRLQYPDMRIHWPAEPTFDISPRLHVEPSDFVVETGDQLHDLCEERGILHLFFAGFATNWCILHRDYAVKAMCLRGYNVLLLRDATEGVEFPDTLEGHWATEIAIREVEQRYGYSVSTESFLQACRRIQ